MKFTTFAILTLSSMAAADDLGTWSLYCGSSCNDNTLVASGGEGGASCTNFDTAHPYCHLTSDETWYKAIVSKQQGCKGGSEEQVIKKGECFEGPWESFQVSLNL